MKVLIPGSFDPCTLGHLALIREAARRYDEVTVGVFQNPDKKGLFSFEERLSFLRAAAEGLPNVSFLSSRGMVADTVKEGGYDALFKGVRSGADRAYEEQMAAYHRERGIETVIWESDSHLTLSSSVVREALSNGAPLSGLCPDLAIPLILSAYFRLKNREVEPALREELLSREEIYQGRILHVVQDKVTLPGGRTSLREMALHHGAVGILPLFEDGTVLMERQYRYPHHRVVYEIPAGKLDSPKEDPREAALRELREETGYTASTLTPIGRYVPSPAILSEVITLYLAEGLTEGECALDEGEFLTLERIPLRRALEWVMLGEIEDGKTQVAVLKAARLKGAEA